MIYLRECLTLYYVSLSQISLICDENKTEVEEMREKELLDEMVKLVDEKNELVHHSHVQNQAIDEDEEIKASLLGSSMLIRGGTQNSMNKDRCTHQ